MKEFIEELKYNQNVNIQKGLENRVDIDYVIERLENISFPIFDNGEILLGKAKDILQYQAKHQCDLDEQDYKDIKEDLERYLKCDENIIVAINYDNGMGYTIDCWDTKDIVKE